MRTHHVWVHRGAQTYPGLVLEWRQVGDTWQALTMFVFGDGRAVTEWMPADDLEPIPGSPTIGSQYG